MKSLRWTNWASMAGMFACAVASLASLLMFVPAVKAQEKQWKEHRLEEPRVRVDVMRDLREGTVKNASFDNYWKFRLDEFTWEENRPKLPDKRKRLKTELRPGRSGQAHDRVNEIAIRSAVGMIADGEIHPVARYNLALVLGDLNKDEGRLPNEPPVPLAEAIPELLKLLDGNRPIDSMNDALRVAALVGIRRHAQLRIDPSNQEPVRRAVLAILRERERPPKRGADAHVWIRRLAADVAGHLGTPGMDRGRTDFLDEMLAIVDNSDESYYTRCKVGRSLGLLDFQPLPPDYDYARVVSALGNLVTDFSQNAKSPKAMLFFLDCSHSMLNGPAQGGGRTNLLAAVGEQQKTRATELNARIEEMLEIVDVRQLAEIKGDAMSKIAVIGKRLGNWLKKQPDEEKVEVGRLPASDASETQ